MSTIDTPKIVNWQAAIAQADLLPAEEALLQKMWRRLEDHRTAKLNAEELERRLTSTLDDMVTADSDVDSLRIALESIGGLGATTLAHEMIEALR